MTDLATVLELLYSARTRYRTACGALAYRHSNALMLQAHRRQAERWNRIPGRGSSMQIAFASSDRAEEPPDLHEERARFWWQPPDRLREEVESAAHGQTRTTVLNGALWWTYTPDWGATSNVDLDEEERAQHSAGGGERFKPLLDPSGLLAVLDFTEIIDAADRVHVRARPRDDLEGHVSHFHLHVVGGADEYELELDRETGIVCRIASFLDGRELAVTELTEVALDERFPEDTFVFTPPPGVEVLPPEPARHRQYTLEEAAKAAPFPVFYIPELPEGDWRLHVNYSEARTRPPMPAHVWLIYHRADGLGTLSLAQRPEGEGGFGWAGYGPPELETVERDGVSLTIVRSDPERGSQNTVALQQDETAIQLQSQELDVDTLIRLAVSLEPVIAQTR
jgi:outer membrane lipoprotein-sorting protein